MAEEIISADRKISLDSFTDGAEKVELTAKSGSGHQAQTLDMVWQYIKPELDGIKARLKALEDAKI